MKLFRKSIELISSAPYRHPIKVVLVATLLAGIGGFAYFFNLPIISDRTQLVNQDLEANQIYRDYRDEFGDEQVLVLVVCAGDSENAIVRPGKNQRQHMKRLATRWADELRQRPDLFANVWERIEGPDWNSMALLYLETEKLAELTDALNFFWLKFEKFLQSPSLENLFAILDELFKAPGQNKPSNNAEQISLALEGLTEFLNRLDAELSAKMAATNDINRDFYSLFGRGQFNLDGYIFSKDGKLLTGYAKISPQSNQRNRFADAMEFSQAALDRALAETPNHLALDAGMAGMPALEYEEMKTAQQDFTRSGVLALVCVTLLFMLAFKNIIRPALAALTLCLAIGMTFGFTWLVIGHLNLLAMIFTVILVALGIDFAIHFVTHYELAISEGCTPAQAIQKTHSSIGGALWMGGITTATAFLSAYLTEFIGLAELGLIAGGGLIICLLCMYIVYPALLFLFDTRHGKEGKTKKTFFNPFKYILPWLNHKNAKLLVTVSLFLLALGYLTAQFQLDTNLLNLQAVDSEASRWQHKLVSIEDRSLFAISTFKDRDSLEQTRSKLEAHSTWIRGTQSAFPSQENDKREMLSAICEKIRKLRVEEPREQSVAGLKRRIWNFRQRIRKYRRANAEAKAALAELENAISAVYKTLSTLPANEIETKIGTIERDVSEDLQKRLPELERAFCPSALNINRLPESLKSRFLGKNGSLALHIYPARNAWQQENLEEFVKKIREIEPNVFGEIVSLYENGQSLIRSFLQASVYSLVAITVLLLFWTRSARTTIFSMIPLIGGVGLLLGSMKLLSIQWNFTNFFALPILIGIGVDSGIHLVKAWSKEGSQTFKGCGKAVFLSSATTIIGFGILASSNHLGVSSLGSVLFLGISFSLLISIVMLPAILKLFLKKS